MVRSSWLTSAVVAVTSVQPTSEKRTVWQLIGSPVALGTVALGTAALGTAALAAEAPGTAARVTSVIISGAKTTQGSNDANRATGCLGGLTTRPVGRHDCGSGPALE